MGGDGGSFVNRRDCIVVKKTEKEQFADPLDESVDRWTRCAITQETLSQPVVMCELGKLYSKINVIQHMQSKDDEVHQFRHIKGLRDLLKCNFHWQEGDRALFSCPVTGLPGNGMYKFYRLSSCGCVVSERGLKEIKGKTCVVCNQPYGRPLTGDEEKDLEAVKEDTGSNDVFNREMRPYLPLNPPLEVTDQLRDEMNHRRVHAKKLKKAAKSKRKAAGGGQLSEEEIKAKENRKKRKALDAQAALEAKERKAKGTISISRSQANALKLVQAELDAKKDSSQAYNAIFLTEEQIKAKRNWASTKMDAPGFSL